MYDNIDYIIDVAWLRPWGVAASETAKLRLCRRLSKRISAVLTKRTKKGRKVIVTLRPI